MLLLIEWVVAQDNEGWPNSQSEFLDQIGAYAGNAGKLRNGVRGFTVDQILAAAELTGANVNWIFGFEKNMFREDKKQSPLDRLKAAVIEVEKELQVKKRR
ncbi:hypothetical protein [Chitinophaga tropicalis]|uniref:Uncharacterized protein n=1 Tax=Chitinophaga tropicalis TaxID=2683588 RepID=A0A7K1UBI0_9BACT|nr:hypothetical protein [Chitinophaga tropicalis]MVT11335.1 hypothetical protein [Chitinophaga tropicalis]